MDPFALRVANLLVGNPDDAAALEMTLAGPEIEFSADTLVALGGAEFGSFPSWRPWRVRAGQILKIGECRRGCRAYLAVAGGIAVEPVLGSRSTYFRAGIGGYRGRPLRPGDKLGIGPSDPVRRSPVRGGEGGAPLPQHPQSDSPGFFVSPSVLPAYSPLPTVQVVPGAQAADFGDGLFASEFKVTPRSDRMGLRLSGPKMDRRSGAELLSVAVAPGTVQVPPDGQPIVLMADAQTLGGYPQVGTIASVDLPLVAQLRPGDSLRFRAIAVEDAQRLLSARERDLALLAEGIGQRLKDWAS
jgi:antagonist of KipI